MISFKPKQNRRVLLQRLKQSTASFATNLRKEQKSANKLLIWTQTIILTSAQIVAFSTFAETEHFLWIAAVRLTSIRNFKWLRARLSEKRRVCV